MKDRTSSPAWLLALERSRAMPRSGFEREGRTSRTSTRPTSVSPGRTGFSQRSSSMPGELVHLARGEVVEVDLGHAGRSASRCYLEPRLRRNEEATMTEASSSRKARAVGINHVALEVDDIDAALEF